MKKRHRQAWALVLLAIAACGDAAGSSTSADTSDAASGQTPDVTTGDPPERDAGDVAPEAPATESPDVTTGDPPEHDAGDVAPEAPAPEDSYGLWDCDRGECLHHCVPYPHPVVVDAGLVMPVAELYCESYAERAAADVCGDCNRILNVRVERTTLDGRSSQPGRSGGGVTARYDAAGLWQTSGRGIPFEPGYCYRTEAQIRLSNGYAARWDRGTPTCP